MWRCMAARGLPALRSCADVRAQEELRDSLRRSPPSPRLRSRDPETDPELADPRGGGRKRRSAVPKHPENSESRTQNIPSRCEKARALVGPGLAFQRRRRNRLQVLFVMPIAFQRSRGSLGRSRRRLRPWAAGGFRVAGSAPGGG